MIKKSRTKLTLIAALTVCLIWVLAFVCFSTREPVYQGRYLSEWLDGVEHRATKTNILEVTQALTAMGDKAALSLVSILKASDSPLKLMMIDLLRKQPFVEVRFIPATIKHQRAAAAFEIMTNHASAAIPALISMMLRSGDDPVQSQDDPLHRAEYALLCIGSKVVPYFRDALLSKQVRVRQSAISSLQSFPYDKNPEAWDYLISALDDSEPEVREGIAIVLGKVGMQSKDVVPRLLSMLNDPSPKVRRHAAFSLGRFGERASDAVSALQKAKTDSDPKVRQAAEEALRTIVRVEARVGN